MSPGVPSGTKLTVTVNGVEREGQVEPRLLLSDFLRHDLHLTGTHVGCEHGVCGACTVLLDGEAVRSCLVFAVQAEGRAITTVEGLAGGLADGLAGGLADGLADGLPVGLADGLAAGEGLHPLQEAFRDAHGLQCGFCTPGVLMSILPFLDRNPDPTEAEVRQALSGNLCRCTGYQGMVDAVLLAAERMRP